MDSEYGIVKYGSAVYGSESALIAWRVNIDWDGDGAFDWRNEASRVTSVSIQRGRRKLLRLSEKNEAIGFQRVPPGRAVVTLDNYDGLYNPYNTNSPLYPNVDLIAEKLIRITAIVGNKQHTLFTGIVSDIKVTYGTSPTATIEAVDGLKYLSDQGAASIIKTGKRIDELINDVLDKSDWRSGWGRAIDKSMTIVPYWWGEGRAYDEICSLSEADLGYLFVNALGEVVHYSRNRSGKQAAIVSEDVVLKNFATSMPWETIRNRVIVAANPMRQETNAVVWQQVDVPLLTAGSTGEYWASFDNPTTNVTCGAGDYSANAAQDGSGADLTANISVSVYSFGTSAKLTVTNNGGTDAYLTKLQTKGDRLVKSTVFSEASTPPANRLMTLDIDWLQNVNVAADYATWLVSYLSQTRYVPTVTIETLPSLQFTVDLFDSVTLDMPTIGINNAKFVVGAIQHRWLAANGQAVQTTWTLEPSLVGTVSGYWVFPTEIGISSKFGF